MTASGGFRGTGVTGARRMPNRAGSGPALSGPDPKLGRVSVTSTDPSATATSPPATEAPGAGTTLLLLDGHSLAYRAFFALPVENFSTTTGQSTNAVYGFTSMLINLLRDERPDARRRSRSTCPGRPGGARSTSSTRPTGPARRREFTGQVDLIKEVLGGAAHPVDDGRELRGGRRHRDAHHPGRSRRACRCSICTGDRDALQLVSDEVTVLYPRRGVSELTGSRPRRCRPSTG